MDSTTPQPKHASAAKEPLLPEPRTSTPSSATGIKRPAPSLLPAFEPLSSSPGLPRPLKRQNTANGAPQLLPPQSANKQLHARLKYPTPVPTSSTGIMSSSPPRRSSLHRGTSERVPLCAVPGVALSENGDTVMMGRSSNSSHVQLSANRLVSRVHVKARYIPAAQPEDASRVEIVCNGWNGLKLHCQGRTWELFKGDSFTSETEGTEIMVDVQDARVRIQWPKKGVDALANLSDSSWDDSPRQTRGAASLQSSPLRRNTRLQSPESPTPAHHLPSSQRLQDLLPDGDDQEEENIQIYEDEPELPQPKLEGAVDVNASIMTEATASFSSDLSEPENDPDEENDPIVHSFGPFGANIENRLASISTQSPKPLKPLHRLLRVSSDETLSSSTANSSAPESPKKEATASTAPAISAKVESPPPPVTITVAPSVINHVINQLAFSRLASTPLPVIMQNLPAEHRQDLAKEALRGAMEAAPCIGIIERQGKDAAGKPLESEYYYMPEGDDDEQRREAVVNGLRKPSLRACRKQHKQYYWKRPKTP